MISDLVYCLSEVELAVLFGLDRLDTLGLLVH